jgi:hypothetical protein
MEIQIYLEDDDDEEEDINVEEFLPKRHRGAGKIWQYVETFANKDQAIEQLLPGGTLEMAVEGRIVENVTNFHCSQQRYGCVKQWRFVRDKGSFEIILEDVGEHTNHAMEEGYYYYFYYY